MVPQRILIIGPSGAGTSTLARTIGQRLAIPIVYLDAINWGPGWVHRDPAPEGYRDVAAVPAFGTLAPLLAPALPVCLARLDLG
jgi:adenylate kinase family enzyme